MTPLFKKLNFKAHPHVLALGYPDSFQKELDDMKPYTAINTALEELSEIEFAITFVTQKAVVDQQISALAPRLKGDAVVWFVYPKGTSKKYQCDFNRDTGWTAMGPLGLEPVRMVAIDADWSALRFRKVAYIKKITRSKSMALTEEAKKRTSHKGK